MSYLVIELQTTNDTTSHLAWSYSDLQQAESKYHSILSAAATSSIPVHTAVILNQEGMTMKSYCYRHELN